MTKGLRFFTCIRLNLNTLIADTLPLIDLVACGETGGLCTGIQKVLVVTLAHYYRVSNW